jgi:hypothetical protein
MAKRGVSAGVTKQRFLWTGIANTRKREGLEFDTGQMIASNTSSEKGVRVSQEDGGTRVNAINE